MAYNHLYSISGKMAFWIFLMKGYSKLGAGVLRIIGIGDYGYPSLDGTGNSDLLQDHAWVNNKWNMIL